MMNDENSTIGWRIRSMREYQKLSREKLAENAGISTQFLADIECGKKGMTVTTLKKICKALCVTSDSIVFGKAKSANNMSDELLSMITSLPENKQEELEQIILQIIKLI